MGPAENGLASKPKKLIIVLAVLKPTIKFLYQNRNYDCILFAVHRAAFSQYIKMHTIFAVTVAGAARHLPRDLIAAQTALIGHHCVVAVGDGCTPGAGPSCSVEQSCRHDGMGQGMAAGWTGPGHMWAVG